VTGDSIIPLTRDHTFVAEWLAAGTISAAQARVHPARHGLTSAIGVEENPEVRSQCRPLLKSHELILLCSDGLTDELLDSEILETVRGGASIEDACDSLIQAALGREGRDNVSVILIDPKPEQEEAPAQLSAPW
jgi:protein phosphatase